MADAPSPASLASVIERRFVFAGSSARLSIATVQASSPAWRITDAREQVATAFGAQPREVVGGDELTRAARLVTEQDLTTRLNHYALERLDSPYALAVSGISISAERYLRDSLRGSPNLLDTIVRSYIFETMQTRPPDVQWPLFNNAAFIPAIVDAAYRDDPAIRTLMEDENVSPGAFSAILTIAFSFPPLPAGKDPTFLSSRDAAERMTKEIYRHDVPFAQSPEIKSVTLQSVIAEARRFVVAPVYIGGLTSATAISTGQFVTAFEAAAAGGGATIVLVGAVALADRVAQHLAGR